VLTALVILCVNNTTQSKCLLVLTALVSYNHVCGYTHARFNNEVESAIRQCKCHSNKFAGTNQLFAYRHVPVEENIVVNKYIVDILKCLSVFYWRIVNNETFFLIRQLSHYQY
jgi:hypothetical protein